MTEEKVKKKLQWHSAFYAGIQIELEEDAANLIFENEHQLATRPLGIDVLIIKKRKEKPIKKNLGKIFKEHNIVEYKSPDDSLCIDDYYKVIGYACLYKSDVQQVDIIKAEEITITFVCKKYPQKLINYLKGKEKYNLEQSGTGIYYIFGELFPVQFVVTSKLSKKDNFWLKNLTNDLKNTEDVEEIFQEYGKYKNSNLHKSVMDIIVKANEGKFKEVQENMCDALIELMQDVIDEKVNEKAKEAWDNGARHQLLEQVSKKLAKGKSIEQIADELEETVETIEKLIQEL